MFYWEGIYKNVWLYVYKNVYSFIKSLFLPTVYSEYTWMCHIDASR